MASGPRWGIAASTAAYPGQTLTLQNLYALLGNDVEAAEPVSAPREIVAPQKSHKKDGVPPKADKSKAKGGKPKATGNEAGAKFQNKNRDQAGPESTPRKGGKDKKMDRHSRTGRTETAKAEHQRLGDEAEAQLEGEEDAEAEAAEEDTTPKVPLVSAADYFKNNAVVEEKKETVVDINPDQLIVKDVEIMVEATGLKKTKAPKAKKTKNFLDVSFTFSDVAPQREERAPRASRDSKKPFAKKGPAPKGKAAKPAAKPASKLTEKNFPSL